MRSLNLMRRNEAAVNVFRITMLGVASHRGTAVRTYNEPLYIIHRHNLNLMWKCLLLPDGRQHPNMLWNGLSLNTSPVEKYIWSPSYDTKPTQMETGFTLSFQRGRGPEEHLYAGSSRSFSTFQTSGGFSAGRSNSQLPGKGLIYSPSFFFY